MAVFGEELRRLRRELGLSQQAFGKEVGYSRTLVSNWERLLDDPLPPRHEIEAWEKKLDLSPGQVDCLLAAAGYQPRYGTSGEREAAGVLRAGEIRADVLKVGRIEQIQREESARLRFDLLPRLGEFGLVESQVPLQADLRHHLDGLLQDYALFGGRADEFATVNSFLADPQGGYLFLTGPSGYGKTALLVQLARQGEAAYHFLNRTYGTADEDLFLRNLCQQLAARHGLGGRLPASSAELRALYPDLLRLPPADGRPVVVLLDGLDEAINWEISPLLFPPDLPDGVKVIFSARQLAERDWPNHLRLPAERVQRLTLGALTADDVRALLRAASGMATPLADDPGWIAQVLRVSAGDPFYVKLLVEDIRDGRMRPEQIGGQPDGLDAYLKGWWEQVAAAVRAQDVRDLLGSLAVARGLLGRDDLIAMFPELSWVLDGVLTEVRRFVIGGEQQGYALCHPRFADYVRRRVGPRALQTYTEALLAYCVNWCEHRSPYAFRYATTHLLEAERWQELLDLVDKPFLRAKVQRLRSYSGALEDLRNGVQAARAVHDPAKMLGLALAHAGLQAKVVQLAAYDVIPLYARFGEPERALELADTIANETQRAKTLVAVARELLPSEPDRAQQIVRQVLANWQRYPAGYDCGTILAAVFSVLPDELIRFLEEVDQFAPFSSLGNSSYLTYQAVDKLAPTLAPALQERLRTALRRALTLPAHERDRSDLRFLLARLEPDPDEAEQFADTEVAHLIVQARRDCREGPDSRLSGQTVDRVLQVPLGDVHYGDQEWALLEFVIVPHVEQFMSAISNKWKASPKKVLLLLDIGLALMQMEQLWNVDVAEKLLLEILYVNRMILEQRFGSQPITSGTYPGGFELFVRRIGEGLAEKNLQAALDLLNVPEIDATVGGECSTYIMAAAAKTDPDAALRLATNRRLAPKGQQWAKAGIAEEVAHTDLERALSIWRGLDPDYVDKPRVLITILQNAPPVDHARAKGVLEAEFEPEPKYQLYKIPVLLDIAVNLKGGQPEQAKAIVQEALPSRHIWLKRDKWGWPEWEFLMAHIIPEVAACGLLDLAYTLVRQITHHHGLQAVAAADTLQVLTDDYVSGLLRDAFEFEQAHQKLEAAGRQSAAMALMRKREDKVYYQRHEVEAHNIASEVFDLHDRIIDRRHLGENSSGFPNEIVDFSERLLLADGPRLLALHLLRHAHHSGWGPDQVSALLAVKAVSVYASSALHFVTGIKNDDLRQLALVELYHRLPLEVVSQGGGISQDRLRAIASLRASAREADPEHKRGFLDEAFALARNSFENADDFTLDLLIEFVREAYPIDSERARQCARELIASTLASARDSAAHRMFELGACGYTFSADERLALEALSDHWVNRLEHIQEGSIKGPPIGDQDAHRLAAIWLARAARSTLPVNRERGLRIVSMASRHADMVAEPTERMRLRRDILKSMLATGDTTLWEEALARSLDFEETIFHVFDWFGQSALRLQQENSAFAPHLLDTIDWAEQLMRV